MARAFRQLWGGFNSGVCLGGPDTVWIAADGGRIRHTRDGGATWITQATPDPVRDQLHSVFFLSDQLHGWAVGDRGHVIATADGGITWSVVARIDDPTLAPGTRANLWDVFFVDATTGWLCGNHLLMKTTNGGTSWATLVTAPALEIYSLHFIQQGGELRGVAAAEPNTVLLTADAGGLLWDVQQLIDPALLCPAPGSTEPLEVWHARFRPGSTPQSWEALVVGGVGNGRGHLFRFGSGDPGTRIPEYHQDEGALCGGSASGCAVNPAGYDLAQTVYGVAPAADGSAISTGYAGQILRRNGVTQGWCDVTDKVAFTTGPLWKPALAANGTTAWLVGTFNALRRSHDGGATWTELGSREAYRPRALFFASESHGWLAGPNELIATTTDGGVSWPEVQSGSPQSQVAFNALRFSHPDKGVVVGGFNQNPHARWTADGTLWTPGTMLPGPGGPPLGLLRDVTWTRRGQWYAAGSYTLVLRTTDAGQTWQQQPVPAAVVPNPSSVILTGAVYEPGTDAVFFVGRQNVPPPGPDQPIALRLKLGSLNWRVMPVPLGPASIGGLEAVALALENSQPVVYAVGDHGIVLRHRVGVSADFQLVPETVGLTVENLEAVTAAAAGPTSEVFAIGVRGAFVHFDGTTWSAPKSDTSLDLTGVYFLAPDRGWACGRGEDRATDTPAAGIVIGYR